MSRSLKIVDPEVLRLAARRCRERGIVIPTLREMQDPTLVQIRLLQSDFCNRLEQWTCRSDAVEVACMSPSFGSRCYRWRQFSLARSTRDARGRIPCTLR